MKEYLPAKQRKLKLSPNSELPKEHFHKVMNGHKQKAFTIRSWQAVVEVTLPNPYAQLINYTMLYDAGDECTAVTGGWAVRSGLGTLTKNVGDMLLTSPAGNSGQAYAQSSINLTDYVGGGMVLRTSVAALSIGLLAVGSLATYAPSIFVNIKTDTIGSKELWNSAISSSSSGHVGFSVNVASKSMNVYNIFLVKSDDWGTLCRAINHTLVILHVPILQPKYNSRLICGSINRSVLSTQHIKN